MFHVPEDPFGNGETGIAVGLGLFREDIDAPDARLDDGFVVEDGHDVTRALGENGRAGLAGEPGGEIGRAFLRGASARKIDDFAQTRTTFPEPALHIFNKM